MILASRILVMENLENIKFNGNKLFNLRKEKGLSQDKLAKKIGVSRQTIYLWESNQRLPDVEKTSKICEVLNINLSEIVDGLGDKQHIKNSSSNSLEENNSRLLEKKNNTKNRINLSKFIKIISIMLLMVIIVYILLSDIKFARLNQIVDKINELNNVKKYYIEIKEIKLGLGNDIKENSITKIYYDGEFFEKIICSKNEILKADVYDLKTKKEYRINEKNKTYQIEDFKNEEINSKLLDCLKLNFETEKNNIKNLVKCFNPNFSVELKDDLYTVKFKNSYKYIFDKNSGIIIYEEKKDTLTETSKKYYEVETYKNKFIDFNLEQYKLIEN